MALPCVAAFAAAPRASRARGRAAASRQRAKLRLAKVAEAGGEADTRAASVRNCIWLGEPGRDATCDHVCE